ncbi:hypothetical protein CRYUN_Cryun07bG0014400 [Craigia yunnanensis]
MANGTPSSSVRAYLFPIDVNIELKNLIDKQIGETKDSAEDSCEKGTVRTEEDLSGSSYNHEENFVEADVDDGSQEPEIELKPGKPCFVDSELSSTVTSNLEQMAARILANLIVMGSGILGRAVFQAYRQALANASKSGVAQETMQNMRRSSKIMAEPEARQILGVTEHSSWEETLKKYDNLFEQNAKNGSFYLQSKVHRAKECLEAVYQKKAQGTPDI